MAGDRDISEHPMTWEIRLAVAYVTVIRYAVACHVLPLSWAKRLVSPYRRSGAD